MSNCRNQYPCDKRCQYNYDRKECPQEKNENMVLAMAYIKWQKWENIYKLEEGFSRGTIFKDLDLPFYGRRCDCQ